MKLSSYVHSLSNKMHEQGQGIIKSLGIVFGDIGTSPIYTLSAIFEFIPKTADNIIGVVSLIIWTLIAVVSVQYAWLAMSLSKKGEGGTIVLREILKPLLKSRKVMLGVTLLSFLGISLFIGDGVITPAISILSAVEGIRRIPGFATIGTGVILAIAALIAIGLFAFQKRGVEGVSKAFGPIMALWFVVLLVTGVVSICEYPWILKALNPYYGLHCLLNNGFTALFILSGVILCATGGEALYADMGHLGRKPIQHAWIFVFIALICNYAGQGAFLITHPQSRLIFFELFYSLAAYLYIPFLFLTIIATIVASQAMISGVFSVVYQGITTQILPMLRVEYTSSRMHAQVYIGAINWLLMGAVLLAMVNFRTSSNLAYAYGLAVSGDMVITSILMTTIFYLQRYWFKRILASLLIVINIAFFSSCLSKLPQGAYWSLVIALIPLSIIVVYYFGQKRMRVHMPSTPKDDFIKRYNERSPQLHKIEGTGLFFVRDCTVNVPSYVIRTMFDNRIMYEDNILVSIVQKEEPFGITGYFKQELAPGLRFFEIQSGYMEVPHIEHILAHAGVNPQAIFYGLDIVVTKNPIWRIYALIRHISPTFVQFHKLPYNKLHGVVTIVEL